MADLMAIVSKAVFEKLAGKAPKVGTRLRMDRYVSANKNLERLAEGGTLYLVTVRPPDEALWLVAILERPKFDGTQWIAKPCDTPITDISSLKRELEFESGKGLPETKGTLGMSLQTPRAVTAGDAARLDRAAGHGAAAGAPGAGSKPEGFPAPPVGAVSTGGGNRRDLMLQAVFDDPTGAAARLVYADALTAANDPRGEFIQLELALEGPLSIRKRALMTERRAELYEQHAATWFPYKAIDVRLSGGMVAAVSGKLRDLTKDAEVFEREPVVEVEVRSLDDKALAKLLAASWLPRIHKLIVRGDIGDDGFAELVASRALANLRALNVTGTELTGEGLAALQNNLPNLRTLVLSNNDLGDTGLTGLVEWEHLPNLETLYLGNCELTAAGVEQLLRGPALGKLAKLALTKNELGNAIGNTFVKRADKLPALEHLELRQAGLGAAAVAKLLEAKLPALRKLDVRANGVKLAEPDPRVTT